jgi:hypothetical protein
MVIVRSLGKKTRGTDSPFPIPVGTKKSIRGNFFAKSGRMTRYIE